MRGAFLALPLLLLASSGQAAVYSLTGQAGDVQCIVYDGKAPYTPPAGYVLSPDPAPNCVTVPLPQPAQTVITKAAFLARFTSAELLAISAAARSSDAINVWLITAQAHDQIDLADPLTKAGLDALVSAGVLTGTRETAVLTP